MNTIFHEKQEGSLCAQHCLNALLQGAYFTPVDLSSLAHKLDEEERIRMAECGEESEEYQRFLEQPSGNMDDSGYFSIQVISSALQVWGLELIPYSSTDERVKSALTDPTTMQAFICNYKDHWFTIRRIGNYWFNLNSLLTEPERISNTYLSLFLAQLTKEGYCIFVIFGKLPDCDADKLEDSSFSAYQFKKKTISGSVSSDDNDQELQQAIKLSLSEVETLVHCKSDNHSDLDQSEDDDEETQLRRAIQLSLECKSRTPSTPSSPCDAEIRSKRLAFFKNVNHNR